MSDQFEVITVGIDTSGRTIRMTRRAKLMFDIACEHADVTPTIVQGSFMGHHSADASAGTHEQAGCIDTRTWDLTADEQRRIIHSARSIAAVAWKRSPPAFDEHMHWLFLGDTPMHADAAGQAAAYKAGTDGLAGDSPDSDWRPDPLVTTFDYDAYQAQEDEMNLNDKLFPDQDDSPTVRQSLVAANQATRKLDRVLTRLADFRKANAERDAGLATQLDRLANQVSDDATKEQLRHLVAELRHKNTDEDSDTPGEP